MMNRKVLTLAITAAITSSAVSAAEIYKGTDQTLNLGGRAESRLSLQDGDVADFTRIRVGIEGKTKISNDLYGVGYWEGEFFSETADPTVGNTAADEPSQSMLNRYAYAGIGGNFGEITYGKNDGSLYTLTNFTDIMEYAGATASYTLPVGYRTNNNLTYSGAFDNFALEANYRFADRITETNGDFGDNKQNGYAFSGVYNFGKSGFSAGAGYAKQDDGKEAMLGGSYTTGQWYFGGLFTYGKAQKTANGGNEYSYDPEPGSVDYNGYELAVGYTVGKTAFTSTYNYAKTNKDTSANNLAFDATYNFNPTFRAYVSYNFNLIKKGNTIGSTSGVNGKATKADAADELALGMRYDF